MSKAEARQRKLKARTDENARFIAWQKKNHQGWGSLEKDDKDYFYVTNIHHGILAGGHKR